MSRQVKPSDFSKAYEYEHAKRLQRKLEMNKRITTKRIKFKECDE